MRKEIKKNYFYFFSINIYSCMYLTIYLYLSIDPSIYYLCVYLYYLYAPIYLPRFQQYADPPGLLGKDITPDSGVVVDSRNHSKVTKKCSVRTFCGFDLEAATFG